MFFRNGDDNLSQIGQIDRDLGHLDRDLGHLDHDIGHLDHDLRSSAS